MIPRGASIGRVDTSYFTPAVEGAGLFLWGQTFIWVGNTLLLSLGASVFLALTFLLLAEADGDTWWPDPFLLSAFERPL